MAALVLTNNVDSTYVDDAGDPSVKIHQQDHDVIHGFLRRFDDGGPSNGQIYIYSSGSGRFILGTAPGGTPGADGESFLWLGAWSNATTYHAGEAVMYGRHAYISRTTHSNSAPQVAGNLPIQSTNWDPMAAGGIDGATGADGDAGAPGFPGATGAPGPSSEALVVDNVSGTITVDAGIASYYKYTLDGNATITFTDSSGRPVSAVTIRLYQGGSGSNHVTWPNSSWALDGGLPPILGTALGDLNILTFDQVEGEWVGYAPGTPPGTNEPPVIEPPPDVFDTLDLEAWVDATDTSNIIGIANYVLGSPATQLGNKKGGLVFVVSTRDDSVDPPVPALSGGGATSWTMIGTKTFGTAGTTRRRGTLFAARDATSGAAAPFTVNLGAAGASHTGVLLKAIRTTVLVESTFVALAASQCSVRAFSDSGETSLAPNVTLAAPQDAADRAVMFVAGNTAATYTPETNHELVGAVLQLSSPLINAWCQWDPVAFDQTPSAVLGTLSNWVAIGTELEQGGVFTPPPSGPPPIDVENLLTTFDTTDQTADYVLGTGILVGDNRMGIVDVVNTTGTSVDPVQPTLAGGGITTWNVAETLVVGTSTSRRRITRFIGWQASAGSPAGFTVGVSAQATTSVSIQAWRTPLTDSAQMTLALANTKKRKYNDAGEVATGPARIAAGDPLAAPANADSRVLATFIWNGTTAGLGTITPEANLTIIRDSDSGSAPATKMVAMLSDDNTFDTTPSCTWATAGTFNWGVIATELGQAV